MGGECGGADGAGGGEGGEGGGDEGGGGGLPNVWHPSDHLPVAAAFRYV